MYLPEKDANGNRHYGQGLPEDKARCAVEIPDQPTWFSAQCSRPRGYGPGGELCKQHAEIAEKDIPNV